MLLIPDAVRKLKAEAFREADAEWEAWLKRNEEAFVKGLPIDEPTPSHFRPRRRRGIAWWLYRAVDPGD